ncbi:MAG: DUF547 domain-containing protein [Deltaproteobacteria bacterium]|nr:DUF547 domain-containing protein [Deltaproteobacteria bacterium]
MKKTFPGKILMLFVLGAFLAPVTKAQVQGEGEGEAWEPKFFSHQLWDNVLKKHVKDGKVDYKAIAKDIDFQKYMHNLAHADPNRYWDKKDQLAFWINAYNACVVKLVIENGFPSSIRTVKGFEDELRCKVERVKLTLNQIKDGILRKDRYLKKEPRSLLMLSNGTKSGPKLCSEAFTDDNIARLLQEKSEAFLADKSKNKFDNRKKKAYLSMLFKWYDKDLAVKYGSLKNFLKKYAPRKYRKMLSGDYKIEYMDFDWSLNSMD